MSRKIYVDVTITTKLIIEVEEGVEFNDVMNDLTAEFDCETDNADILDSQETTVVKYNITDSK